MITIDRIEVLALKKLVLINWALAKQLADPMAAGEQKALVQVLNDITLRADLDNQSIAAEPIHGEQKLESSAAVAQDAVNVLVAGSNPASPATSNGELATAIEERLKIRPASFGHAYREPHLLFADEAPIVLDALRTARQVNANRGE